MKQGFNLVDLNALFPKEEAQSVCDESSAIDENEYEMNLPLTINQILKFSEDEEFNINIKKTSYYMRRGSS